MLGGRVRGRCCACGRCSEIRCRGYGHGICGCAKRGVDFDSKKQGGDLMNLNDLNRVAEAMVAPGRGILAADESSGTIKKRFDAIGVENTEDNRRDYRELMFRTSEAMSKHISGVILYDETIWQKAKDGTPLVELIKKAGALPGIKVDEGTK